MQSIKEYQKKAKEILFSGGVLPRLCISAIGMLLLILTPFLLAEIAVSFLMNIKILSGGFFVRIFLTFLLALPFWLLITAPSLMEWLRFAIRHVDESILLEYGGASDYWQDVRSGSWVFLRGLVPVALTLATFWIPVFVTERMDPMLAFYVRILLTICLIMIAVSLSLLFLCMTRYGVLMPYFSAKGMKRAKAKQTVKTIFRTNRDFWVDFCRAFVGPILLSVVTLGVYLIVYTIPLMTVTVIVAAEDLKKDTFEI